MYKLITLGLAALPFILLAKALFGGQLLKSRWLAEFKKNVDFAVSVLLFFIGCMIIYTIVKLLIWT